MDKKYSDEISVSEVAEMAGVKQPQIRQLVKRGLIDIGYCYEVKGRTKFVLSRMKTIKWLEGSR